MVVYNMTFPENRIFHSEYSEHVKRSNEQVWDDLKTKLKAIEENHILEMNRIASVIEEARRHDLLHTKWKESISFEIYPISSCNSNDAEKSDKAIRTTDNETLKELKRKLHSSESKLPRISQIGNVETSIKRNQKYRSSTRQFKELKNELWKSNVQSLESQMKRINAHKLNRNSQYFNSSFSESRFPLL